MMYPARTAEERRDLVIYIARKIAVEPLRLVGQTPFEVNGIVNRKGELVGAVYYTNFRRSSIEMGWAGEKGWLTRGNLAEIFGYPFHQLGVLRVWGLIHRHNKESRRLADKLGCQVLCALKDEYGEGQDAILYEMRKSDCRWIAPIKPQEQAHAA